MIARGKKLDGSSIEFVFEDKGLLSHETDPQRCPPDFIPVYVTMLVINGETLWSSVPADKSTGKDNARAESDSDVMRAHGIDPQTIVLSAA